MKLMDLGLREVAPRGEPHAVRRRSAFDPAAAVAEVGGEVAELLTQALERIHVLGTTGQIDRPGLRALRSEVEAARRVGIMAQQISRLARGRVRVAAERLDLTHMLRDALVQRSREIEARGLEVRQVLGAAEVLCDATLLHSLLQTMIDWSFEHTVSRIDYSIDLRPWPAHARLHCAFWHRPPDEVADDPSLAKAGAALENVSWHLLELTAQTMGLTVDRRDDAARTRLTIEFPKTVGDSVEGVTATALDDPDTVGMNSRPLAGSHLLVVSSRREVRNLVREATRAMGMMVDFVTSVEAAAEFCRGALPHALVYEGVLGGDAFGTLRRELLEQVPNMAFIEIAEHGKAFAVHNLGSHQYASVGRDAILESLPAALMFELARLR